MPLLKHVLLVVVLMAGLVTLAGCSDDDDNTRPTTAGSSQPNEARGDGSRFIDTAPNVNERGPATIRETVSYMAAPIQVNDFSRDDYTYNANVEGEISYPTSGEGPFPIVLYQHGRHATCVYYDQYEQLSSRSCPDFSPFGSPLNYSQPIESYKGYEYMANDLASHGYVVISIDANDVNDSDSSGDTGALARAQLILHHLDIFRRIDETGMYPSLAALDSNTPEPTRFSDLQGRIDFSRVGIMGHSRGGQGVSRTILYNQQPNRITLETGPNGQGELSEPFTAAHELGAVFALAPTDFFYISAPNTTFATLLPSCDGDVSNLQGARLFDDSRYIDESSPRPKFQIMVQGTNHNYSNTLWTSDDYARQPFDSYCTESEDPTIDGRATPEEQRGYIEFLISSYFRLFVGGENRFASYWERRAHLPTEACPTDRSQAFCDAQNLLSIQAPEGERLVIDAMGDYERQRQFDGLGEDGNNGVDATGGFVSDEVTLNTLGLPVRTTGFDRFELCSTVSEAGNLDADGCPSATTYAKANQAFVQWSAPGAVYTSTLGGLDASDYGYFTLRAGVPINKTRSLGRTDQNFRIRLTDVDGRSAAVTADEYGDILFLPPGNPDNGAGAKTTLNMIGVPLAAFSNVDLSQLENVELIFDQTNAGALQFTDIQFQRIDYSEVPVQATSDATNQGA